MASQLLIYTVKPGDTLAVLATKLMGPDYDYWDLMQYNSQIQNPDLIYVGDQIYYPSGAGEVSLNDPALEFVGPPAPPKKDTVWTPTNIALGAGVAAVLVATFLIPKNQVSVAANPRRKRRNPSKGREKSVKSRIKLADDIISGKRKPGDKKWPPVSDPRHELYICRVELNRAVKYLDDPDLAKEAKDTIKRIDKARKRKDFKKQEAKLRRQKSEAWGAASKELKTYGGYLYSMTINEIGDLISKDWKNPYFGAVPYIEAMQNIDKEGKYYLDTGESVVAYFIANSGSWRGDIARNVKKELKKRLKTKDLVLRRNPRKGGSQKRHNPFSRKRRRGHVKIYKTKGALIDDTKKEYLKELREVDEKILKWKKRKKPLKVKRFEARKEVIKRQIKKLKKEPRSWPKTRVETERGHRRRNPFPKGRPKRLSREAQKRYQPIEDEIASYLATELKHAKKHAEDTTGEDRKFWLSLVKEIETKLKEIRYRHNPEVEERIAKFGEDIHKITPQVAKRIADEAAKDITAEIMRELKRKGFVARNPRLRLAG